MFNTENEIASWTFLSVLRHNINNLIYNTIKLSSTLSFLGSREKGIYDIKFKFNPNSFNIIYKLLCTTLQSFYYKFL